MAAKVVKLAQPASPTINQVFEEFLAEQCVRLLDPGPNIFRPIA
jgi:hypothetical protein